jgi:preprotein translocase subunit SecG
MTTLILIVHLVVCFFLIFIVLIQSGKGAELGAAFGGSSQTLFGARGAATFFSKLTTIAAVVFMLTSLTLAFFAGRQSSVVKTITTKPPASTEQQKGIPQGSGPLQGVQPTQPADQEASPVQTEPSAPLKQ